LTLALVYLNPFIGDWDGLDYTIDSLGRALVDGFGPRAFPLVNHFLYVIARAIFGIRLMPT
jgi:hypothetical protein